MSVSLKPLSYHKAYLGKVFKSTKKRYVWKFELDGKEHEVVLTLSFFGHKESISVDGECKYENDFTSSALDEHTEVIDSHKVKIKRRGYKKYDLFVYQSSFWNSFKPKRTKTDYVLEVNDAINIDLEVKRKARRSSSNSSDNSMKKRPLAKIGGPISRDSSPDSVDSIGRPFKRLN